MSPQQELLHSFSKRIADQEVPLPCAERQTSPAESQTSTLAQVLIDVLLRHQLEGNENLFRERLFPDDLQRRFHRRTTLPACVLKHGCVKPAVFDRLQRVGNGIDAGDNHLVFEVGSFQRE